MHQSSLLFTGYLWVLVLILVLAAKALNDQVLPYICNLLTPSEPPYGSWRSSSSVRLMVPKCWLWTPYLDISQCHLLNLFFRHIFITGLFPNWWYFIYCVLFNLYLCIICAFLLYKYIHKFGFETCYLTLKWAGVGNLSSQLILLFIYVKKKHKHENLLLKIFIEF